MSTLNDNFLSACKHGNLGLVKLCVELGANIDCWQGYAIKWACNDEYIEIVKYLVSQGADTSFLNKEYYKMAGKTKIYKYLQNL